MFRSFFLLVTVLITIIAAGPNEDVTLFFDAIAATDEIDSVGPCPKESTLVTAVRIAGASALYSYEFYINFDTSSLAFVSGKRDNSQYTNFLELNDGSCSFSAPQSRNDSTRILVGNFLSGDDNSQCVSDSGLLGLFTFRHKKKNDSTVLTINSTKLIDCDLEEDHAKRCTGAMIVPSVDIPVTYFREKRMRGPKVEIRHGAVNITFAKKTPFRMTVVNTLGKKIFSQNGYAECCRYTPDDCRMYTAGLAQVRIVRVCYAGNELVIPVVQ